MALMMESSPIKASPTGHLLNLAGSSGQDLEPLYEDDDMMMDEDSRAFSDDDDDDGGGDFSLARPPTPTQVFRTSTPLSPPLIGVQGSSSSHTPFGAHTQPQWGEASVPQERAPLRGATRPPATPFKESRSSFGSDRSSGGGVNYSRFKEDFEVIKVLGRGSFGEVYHVKSRIDGIEYAVKCTQRQFRGEGERNRYLKEVKALGKLCQDDTEETRYIVRYFSAWFEDRRLYMQMELCDTSLDVWVANGGRLSLDQYFDFIRQMLLALDAIHRQSLVHLDVKPANIFIKNGHYKLGDFGLVTFIGSGTSESLSAEEGDTRYMSADLLLTGPKDLTKCDIFSLGITVYELVLGEPLPANGPEWQAIRHGHLRLPPQKDLAVLLTDMMAPDPCERPPAKDLLTHHPRLRSKIEQIERELEGERNRRKCAEEQLMKTQKPPSRARVTRASTWCPS